MAQALIEQTIVFISPTNNFNEQAIWSNSLIQTLVANSAGADAVYGYQNYANWNGTTQTWTFSALFYLRVYIQPSYQATVQANLPTLRSQLPQYSIYTWGNSSTFGN
jgi:hypothetical protein